MKDFRSSGLFLIIISIVIAVLILDLGLRLTNYESFLSPKSDLWTSRYFYRSDPVNGFDLRENFPLTTAYIKQDKYKFKVWTNNLGCFDVPYNNESEYILLLGDSFTWGYSDFKKKWGTILEKRISRRVLKCGVGAYGTEQELNKAIRVIDLIGHKPQAIIVGYYMNDVINDFNNQSLEVIDGFLARRESVLNMENGNIEIGQVEEHVKREIEDWDNCRTPAHERTFFSQLDCLLTRNSIIYNLLKVNLNGSRSLSATYKPFLRNELIKISESPLFMRALPFLSFDHFPWMENKWKKHLGNILKFKKMAENQQADLVFVLMPEDFQVYPQLIQTNWGPDARHIEPNRPNQYLRNFFSKHNIDYIDLLSVFRSYAQRTTGPEAMYWKYNKHLKSNVELLIADEVSKHLKENYSWARGSNEN